MTTIIATREALYTDSLCNYTVPFRVRKAVRVGACIYGASGDDLDSFIKFIEWLRDEAPKPKMPGDEDFDVLEVSKGGIYLWSRQLTRTRVREKCYAIGSGSQYAIGALDAGATPEKALALAAKRDSGTRLPMQILRV